MNGMLRLLGSMLLLATPVTAGPTPTPTVSPTPSPASSPLLASSTSGVAHDEKATRSMELWLYVYDLDGEFGGFLLPEGRSIIPEGEYSEYQFKGEAPHQSPYLGWVYDTPKANGTPFLFRVYSPQFGSIMGFSRVGIGWPAFFHVPVRKSEVGLPDLYSEPESGSRDPFMTFGIYSPLIADDHSQPTFSTFASVLPNKLPLVTTATVTYEEGNALYELGQEVRQYGAATINTYSSLGAYWGNYGALYSNEVGFSREDAPVGPMRVMIQCEGYGSDEVSFSGENIRFFLWRPLLSPAMGATNQSGPTPGELLDMIALTPEEGDFIRETALREKLLGQSRLFTNLAKASDVNGDGCLDAADYQVVVGRTAPEAR